jgi:hypothetical protein
MGCDVLDKINYWYSSVHRAPARQLHIQTGSEGISGNILRVILFPNLKQDVRHY